MPIRNGELDAGPHQRCQLAVRRHCKIFPRSERALHCQIGRWTWTAPRVARVLARVFPSAFGRCALFPIGTPARIAPRVSQSITQSLFNAPQVLTEPGQNKFALFAARHFVAKQPEDQWIGCLANSSNRHLGSLCFQSTQALPDPQTLSGSRLLGDNQDRA